MTTLTDAEKITFECPDAEKLQQLLDECLCMEINAGTNSNSTAGYVCACPVYTISIT